MLQSRYAAHPINSCHVLCRAPRFVLIVWKTYPSAGSPSLGIIIQTCTSSLLPSPKFSPRPFPQRSGIIVGACSMQKRSMRRNHPMNAHSVANSPPREISARKSRFYSIKSWVLQTLRFCVGAQEIKVDCVYIVC
ncbi:unnamed protein product [Periconia digitata]|uniref:Uncharacterized protein n=1 Tax=Periconia digitata TaxID=1303443 RepID=A0A9W4U8J8_9PLEO|nr:unnamed protein product [Periconia digitata]